ncbi:MAG: hypothetical protein U1F00_16940 [Rhodoferax sp.]
MRPWRAVRELKRAIGQLLLADGHGRPCGAGHPVYVIDLAIDCMGESAASNTTWLLRSDESYRMFF